jgi:hypothetical protein
MIYNQPPLNTFQTIYFAAIKHSSLLIVESSGVGDVELRGLFSHVGLVDGKDSHQKKRQI